MTLFHLYYIITEQKSQANAKIFFSGSFYFTQKGEKKYMRKLTLNIPETETIDINGDIFEIHKSDIDILNKSAELQLKYANLKKDDLQAIQSAVNDIVAFIDEILGDGAAVKISKGRPVSIKLAIEWLTAICAEVGDMGEEYIKEKYE